MNEPFSDDNERERLLILTTVKRKRTDFRALDSEPHGCLEDQWSKNERVETMATR